MSWKLKLKRGTLADVSNAAANSSLDQWSPIIISNEDRLVVAKSSSEYFDVGTVRSVSGTGNVSGLTLSGTVTGAGSLTLGGTLVVTPSNFDSQTQKYVLAAPNAANGKPTFRALVASDIPTLNQNTTGNAGTATKLQTARTIGGVNFDGTANINLPGVNITGNQNTTGSAATLTTARTINGTNFNGSANITTANWGTARNITIGNTTKSFNGGDNIAWSLAEIGGQGIPEGGDEGQLLVKSSEDDYDAEWKSPNPVAVKVYKADNKALNVVTTEDGHYVKVTKADGVTELTVSVTNNGVSPPITTQGPIPRYLAEDPLPVSNIGPIWHDGYASMMTWRTIGSYTGYASLEVGKIAHFDISSVPPGYVASNADISGSAFEALRAAIGQSTTRDARGVVIRDLDNGRGLDPGRTHGTYQADGIRESNLWVRALTGNNSIINPAPDGEFTRQTYTGTTSQGSSLVSNTPLPTKVTLGSATETRMKNLALLSFWKF